MNFTTGPGNPIKGIATYDKRELSFDFEPDKFGIGEHTFSLILLTALQIVVSYHDNRVLFLRGYCPLNSRFTDSSLKLPTVISSKVYISSRNQEYQVGFNYDLDSIPTDLFIDRKNNVIKIGKESEQTVFHQASSSLIIGLEDGSIVCLYNSFVVTAG